MDIANCNGYDADVSSSINDDEDDSESSFTEEYELPFDEEDFCLFRYFESDDQSEENEDEEDLYSDDSDASCDDEHPNHCFYFVNHHCRYRNNCNRYKQEVEQQNNSNGH